MRAALHKAADQLDETARRAGVLPHDPLGGVLLEVSALTRVLGDTAERLQAVGTAPLDTRQIIEAIERASTAIAFRIAGRIARRTAVMVGVSLFVATTVGGVIGFVVCWFTTRGAV